MYSKAFILALLLFAIPCYAGGKPRLAKVLYEDQWILVFTSVDVKPLDSNKTINILFRKTNREIALPFWPIFFLILAFIGLMTLGLMSAHHKQKRTIHPVT